MMFEPRIGPDGRDDDLTRALRALYAPPSAEAYWLMLERRVLAGLGRAEEEGWWRELARWCRVGVLVASAAVVLAGVALWRDKQASEQFAFETLIESSRVAPMRFAANDGSNEMRDATLRFVISP
jgi:hypothetical protein